MKAFNSRMAFRWALARARAFSVVYLSAGRMRSASGEAAEAAPARPRTGAARSASARRWRPSLPLKDLVLIDGDRLAPPALIAGQGDVLARHGRLGALTVAHGEEHVIAGGEVCPVRSPDVPLFRRCTAGRRHQRTPYEEQ